MELGSVSIRNPIVLAAGTCGTMGEIADAIDLHRIGAITTKSITIEPREGNPPHRIADLPIGMLNAIGLKHIAGWLPGAKRFPVPSHTKCVQTRV